MAHFSRCGYPFPQTEVANQVNQKQTSRHVPFDVAQVVNAFTVVQLEHFASRRKGY